ncbi:MAG TPA: DUF6510 family protein [Acidimicrobiales bacterium]|nr:DUF6510 family protein [Acidimicrobiales bacterium]
MPLRDEHDEYLDGNVLHDLPVAGGDIELTLAVATCAGCGASEPMARALVYGGTMGQIARCAHCGDVVIRLTRIADTVYVDLRGTRVLRLPAPRAT